jgi:hypothetical protein
MHLFDCADVAHNLVVYGRAAGHRWTHVDVRTPSRNPVANKAGALAWHARRVRNAWPADYIHLHYGWRARSLRWPPRRPAIIHLHGSDLSIHYQTNPDARAVMEPALREAVGVMYSTPDLGAAAREIRPDAVYLPNPVELTDLPSWSPEPEPVVRLSSRFERRKGSVENLQVVTQVLRATKGTVRIEALDWGDADSREEARRLGVRLVPKMSRRDYLIWLAGAHVVLGHQGGIFAISEFQSAAIGVPTVMRVGEGFYPAPVPVLGGPTTDDLVTSVLDALRDPAAASTRLAGRAWVEQHHRPQLAVERLAAFYRELS